MQMMTPSSHSVIGRTGEVWLVSKYANAPVPGAVSETLVVPRGIKAQGVFFAPVCGI